WYGDDQTSSLEDSFDRIFRGMLENAYTIVGRTPPDFLSESVLGGEDAGTGGGVMARAETPDDAELLEGPVRVPEGYLFSVRAPEADSVHLAGGFNDWSTSATPMSDEDGDGTWTVVADIAPGTYEYKFAIDGGARWVEDQGNPNTAPDPYGGVNSVLVAE
ncbi:MAG: hypothetical protein GF400_08230, partial [Candidatus Eisenbacteria bacterium]|nr:hypothetical protein [Candidatus Eisenbacteria bacterium]